MGGSRIYLFTLPFPANSNQGKETLWVLVLETYTQGFYQGFAYSQGSRGYVDELGKWDMCY